MLVRYNVWEFHPAFHIIRGHNLYAIYFKELFMNLQQLHDEFADLGAPTLLVACLEFHTV